MWLEFELLNLRAGFGNYVNLLNGGTVMVFIVVLLFSKFWARKLKITERRRLSKSRNRNIPGPGHHIFGRVTNVLALNNVKDTLSVLEKWSREYRPIFKLRFGPMSLIFLNSPEYAQKLLTSTDINHYEKGSWYGPVKSFWKDGLIISKGEKWKSRRKLLDKHMFSYKTLLSYMQIFNEEASSLVRIVAEMGNTQEDIEIDHIVKKATLNTITKSSLGKELSDFKIENAATDESLIHLVEKGKEIAITRILNPLLLFEPLFRLHPLGKIEERTKNTIWTHITNAIVEDNSGKTSKATNSSLKTDLLASGVPIEGVLEETVTLFTAGYDTSASTLQFLLFFLSIHPHHQDLCRKEVDSLFLNKDDSDDINYQDLGKLKHLEMCLSETLRLFPIVFITLRKLRAPLQLDEDLELPTGSEVAIFLPGIHKNSNYYPDPHKFIPERFLPDEAKKRHQYTYIPFVAGPRKCIGFKFATMQLICITAKLLRHYTISTKDKQEDFVLLPYITITLETPLKFRFERRPYSDAKPSDIPLSSSISSV